MRQHLTVVAVVLLVASASVAIAAMIHGAGHFELDAWYAWVLSPYITQLILQMPFRHPSEARRIASCVTAGLTLVVTWAAYIGSFWHSASSTAALIFIFAPIYLLIGGTGVWALAWYGLAKWSGRSHLITDERE